MKNLRVAQGGILIGVALFFGIQARGYDLGSLSEAGPGFFPLVVSGLVALIGLVMLFQARLEPRESINFDFRNIALILASLVGFVIVASYLKMIAAVAYLVFVSSLAGSDYSWKRNLKLTAVLLLIAVGFRHFLGLQLPLL